MATEATQVVPYVDLRRGIGTDALSNSALAGLLLDSVEAVSVIAGVPLVDREEWASLSFRRSSPAGILRVPGVLRDIKRVRYV
ncbi:hypothetical protein, partial [Candidatus Poriferisodalis sp.]|uniref:hypothetical protein n=1 Tax=Candidatus Poriferisodalis sp. TaxID=3101277 RepID=UPI003B02714E